MLPLASDEDVLGAIIRGLRRRCHGLDLVRVRDVGLQHTHDPLILDWAAAEGRVLITRDRRTLIPCAWNRVKAGQPMPGVLALRRRIRIHQAIGDILLVAQCYPADEIKDQVLYLPL
jgi:hypothetical protein